MVKALANHIVEVLRGQPLVLALLIMMMAVLVGIGLLLREVSNSIERKDMLIAQLTKCAEDKR